MGKVFCMGDIHGHYRELYQRLDQLGNLAPIVDEGAADKLILLGDYIDGGPHSRQVLEILRSNQLLCPERFIVLRGNHEEAFLTWLDTYTGPYAGEPDEDGIVPRSDWLLSMDPEFQTLRTFLTKDQWAFFRQVLPTLSETSLNMETAQMVLSAKRDLIDWLRGLPCYYETETQIFVHAGVNEDLGRDWKRDLSPRTLLGQSPPKTGRFYKDVIAGHIGTAVISGNRDFHDIFWDGESHYYCDGTVSASGRIPVLVYDEDKKTYCSLGPDIPSRRRDAQLRRQVRGELIPLEKPKEAPEL